MQAFYFVAAKGVKHPCGIQTGRNRISWQRSSPFIRLDSLTQM